MLSRVPESDLSRSFWWAVLGLLLVGFSPIRSQAEPGESHYAYTSIDGVYGYTPVIQLSEHIQGSDLGYKSSAFRFKSVYSDPMEYMLVVLYASGEAGTENSARVVLYSDAAGKVGAKIKEFNIDAVNTGSYKGYLLNVNDTSYPPVIRKGLNYWVSVEPLSPTSKVEWAYGTNEVSKGFRQRVTSEGTEYKDDLDHIGALTVCTMEPYLPFTPVSAAPLTVGAAIPGESGGALTSLGSVAQAPLLGVAGYQAARFPVILGENGRVILHAQDETPGLPGTKIATFGEPCGDFVTATLQVQKASATTGALAVTAADNHVLIGGLTTGSPRLAARAGMSLTNSPGTLATINELDGNGSTGFFLGTLKAPGPSGLVLCAALADGTVKLLAAPGMTVGERQIQSVATLVGYAGSLAQGRWRVDGDRIGVRVTFAAKMGQALFSIPVTATAPTEWTSFAQTGTPLVGGPLDGLTLATIDTAAFGRDGVAYTAHLVTGKNGLPTAANAMILARQDSNGFTLLARQGSAPLDGSGEPIPAARFTKFGAPVYAAGGRVAYAGTLAGGTGGKSGLWWVDANGSQTLLARAGMAAPHGGNFTAFTTVVLPGGTGVAPVFMANLAPDAASGLAKAENGAIFTVGSDGELRVVARLGGLVSVNYDLYTLQAFSALTGAAGSTGAAHGYDAAGALRLNATIRSQNTPVTTKKVQLVVPTGN